MNTFMLGTAAVLAIYRGAQRVWEWTGAALFPRFWSGPLDPTGQRLFQDAAGTTPANQAGQPVGKVARAAGTVDASQATALSRPTLARWPSDLRRNAIDNSVDLTSGSWGLSRVTAIKNGDELALKETTANGAHLLSWPSFIWPSSPVCLAVELKSNGTEFAAISAVNTGARVVMNLLTGEVKPPSGEGAPTAYAKYVGNGFWRLHLRASLTGEGGINIYSMADDNFDNRNYEGDPSRGIIVRRPQVEQGVHTPYQATGPGGSIVDNFGADNWHLYNDGGDSLLAPLPAGVHEVATVGIDGRPYYTSLTGDGSPKNILLGADRIADIFVREGSLSDADRTRLEEYWQSKTGAGYLIPPGMVPGVRGMLQEYPGRSPAMTAGSQVGMLLSFDSVAQGDLVSNGSFLNGLNDWNVFGTDATHSITVVPGGVHFLSDTLSPALGLDALASVKSGALYQIEIDVAEYVSGSIKSDRFIGSPEVAWKAGLNITYAFCNLTTNRVNFTRNSVNVNMTIRRISIREVTGIPGYQATALSRPTLARWPKGGRRNLLTHSEDLSNSSWVKVNGSVSGTRFTPSTASATQHRLDKIPTSSAGPQTFSVAAKPAGYRWISLRIGSVGAAFDTQDGVVGSVGVGVSASIFPLIGGGFLCVVSVEIASAGDIARIGVEPSNVIATNWTGDGVSGMDIMYAQLEQGMTRTPYQAVAGSNDITEAGIPDVWHLRNDGGDSLPAVLPAGAWEIAWVTHLGAIGYARVTSDGTTGTDLLRAERMADVAVKRGRFTSYEKAQLETQWGKYKP